MFSIAERRQIFSPLFQSLDSDFSLRVSNPNIENREFLVNKPTKALKKQILPSIEKEKKHTAFVVAYVDDKVTGEVSKNSIRKVLAVEPYKRRYVIDGDRFFSFNHDLVMQVRREEGRFLVTSDELDITVWGDTFEAAEEAVGFTIGRLYDEYYNEPDANLTIGAIDLKNTLHSLIKKLAQ